MPRISMTRITADTPVPQRHKYELVLRFPLDTYGEPVEDPEAVGRMFTHLLHQWDEGRYPFEVEMIDNGVFRCMKRAVYEAICEKTQKEFGTEVVENENGRGNTSRWYLEAQARNKEAQVPYSTDQPTAELRAL